MLLTTMIIILGFLILAFATGPKPSRSGKGHPLASLLALGKKHMLKVFEVSNGF